MKLWSFEFSRRSSLPLDLFIKRKDGREVPISTERIILSVQWKRGEEEITQIFVNLEGVEVNYDEYLVERNSPTEHNQLHPWHKDSGESMWNLRAEIFNYSTSREEVEHIQEKVIKTLTPPLYIGAGGENGTLHILRRYEGMIFHHRGDIVSKEIEKLAQQAVKAFADQYHFDIAKAISNIFFDGQEEGTLLYIKEKEIEQKFLLLDVENAIKKAIDEKKIVWPDFSDWEGDSFPHIHFDVDVKGKIYHGKLSYDDGYVSTVIGSVPNNPLVGFLSAEEGDEAQFEGPIKDWTYMQGPSFEYNF